MLSFFDVLRDIVSRPVSITALDDAIFDCVRYVHLFSPMLRQWIAINLLYFLQYVYTSSFRGKIRLAVSSFVFVLVQGI